MNPTFRSILATLAILLLVSPAVRAAEVAASFPTAATVPITAATYTATGNTIEFTLGHAPLTGADLTVVKLTGAARIQGFFGNLAQGQVVDLSFAGKTYSYVANYHGGNGNDLVLQWQNSRLGGWGSNGAGQLAQGKFGEFNIPTASPMPLDENFLAGKTVISSALGGYVGVVACSDGTLASWGRGDQLGRSGPTEKGQPYLVDTSGVLAGKTVIDMSGGFEHAVVLCSDGTIATWGRNVTESGVSTFPLPVAVSPTGALAGKTVTTVSCGVFHVLALCSDGTVAGWGRNGSGQLGNGSPDGNTVSQPVAVSTSGLLAGKQVISIATGRDHAVALCSDGTLATWGLNSSGQLGNNSLVDSKVPVAVDRSGILAGKTVVAVTAGGNHSMALCSDGTLATWGANSEGTLGNNSTTPSSVPVAVVRTGVLSGKTITGIASGQYHCAVTCSDGTVATWGYNGSGQLGSPAVGNPSLTSRSTVPVAVDLSLLKAGERVVRLTTGCVSSANFIQIGSPPLPVATALPASQISDTSAFLNGSVNANGTATSVSFEYGLTTDYGSTIGSIPGNVSGTAAQAVGRPINGLLPGTTYHFRVSVTGAAGTVKSADQTFTTTNQTALAGLSLSRGTLSPGFSGAVADYLATVPADAAQVTVTPVTAVAGATVTVNGAPVTSGSASGPIDLATGNTTIAIVVTAPGGGSGKTYTVTVNRLPETLAFTTAASVPVTAGEFFADGDAPPFALGFAPPTGTGLTVVNNTGRLPIRGSFANLVHGQMVEIAHSNAIYRYLVNYYGGSGNDLVLQWANTRPAAWGYNSFGQVGDGTRTVQRDPVAVISSGALAGRSILAMSAGINHSLALCSDGTMLAWGSGSSGVLGTGSFTALSTEPLEVDTTGVLAGKTVSSISAGFNFNLALCTDGTTVAWGQNNYGQLGDGTEYQKLGPVDISNNGVLAGKRVIAVSSGSSHGLALCDDGTVASWGASFYGALGFTPQLPSNLPVAVDRSGVLSGKTVVAIAAGGAHNIVLCSDGTLASWGWNDAGQLGNNSTADSPVPVAVTRTGALAGKVVVGISASDNHSMALCSDGTLVAWGANYSGQLGDGTTTNRATPVRVRANRGDLLNRKQVIGISLGRYHSLATCSDGTLAVWGGNSDGQLGNGGTASSAVPVATDRSPLGFQGAYVAGATGPPASHSFGLLAVPLPSAATAAAESVSGATAVLRGSAGSNGAESSVSFEYGPTEAYGTTVAATPASLAADAGGSATAAISGLTPGTTYHFRIRVESASGTRLGNDMTFRAPNNNAYLSRLTPYFAPIHPAFDKGTTEYIATITTGQELSLNFGTEDPLATVTVNGIPAGAGAGTVPLNLPDGATTVPVVVTAEDGVTRRTYNLTVTRIPRTFRLTASNIPPATAEGVVANGNIIDIELAHEPVAGRTLRVIENTAIPFIQGVFRGLNHGQTITLDFGGKSYRYVVNYHGGSGNDLVLQWADAAVYAWGSNSYGQLGSPGDKQPSAVPVEIFQDTLLRDKNVLALSTGYLHSLALCSDGTMASWGYNSYGQLGSGPTDSRPHPGPVLESAALGGKRVVAISSGAFHNLALCSDGTIAAWGYNNHGQLGDGSTESRDSPVLVNLTGALTGKSVVAVAAGAYHSFALCSDGTLAAWGYNDEGELGNGGSTGSPIPQAVGGALTGKKVLAVSAGQYHALALCTDGTLAGWGYNKHGQVGNGGDTTVFSPIAISANGVLAGKTVTAIHTGGRHSLALCDDGTLAAWGSNSSGQLGDGSTTQRPLPVEVIHDGVLSGKQVTSIAAGEEHSLANCADGSIATWGSGKDGRLGNGGIESTPVPVLVTGSTLPAGSLFGFGTSGASSAHGLGMVGMPATMAAGATAVPGDLIAWRETHFGRSDNEGIAADLHDADQDGLVNLVEYAFGLDPMRSGGSVQLPAWRQETDHMILEFIEPPGVSGVRIGAAASTGLDSGEWTPIADEGSGAHHLFRVPIDQSRKFMRLEVTQEP